MAGKQQGGPQGSPEDNEQIRDIIGGVLVTDNDAINYLATKARTLVVQGEAASRRLQEAQAMAEALKKEVTGLSRSVSEYAGDIKDLVQTHKPTIHQAQGDVPLAPDNRKTRRAAKATSRKTKPKSKS